MTSKEALSDLFFLAIGDENHTKECKEVIEKDLEILEILKKHYDVNSLIVSLNNFISFCIYNDDKDFKKVKEWLENE